MLDLQSHCSFKTVKAHYHRSETVMCEEGNAMSLLLPPYWCFTCTIIFLLWFDLHSSLLLHALSFPLISFYLAISSSPSFSFLICLPAHPPLSFLPSDLTPQCHLPPSHLSISLSLFLRRSRGFVATKLADTSRSTYRQRSKTALSMLYTHRGQPALQSKSYTPPPTAAVCFGTMCEYSFTKSLSVFEALY